LFRMSEAFATDAAAVAAQIAALVRCSIHQVRSIGSSIRRVSGVSPLGKIRLNSGTPAALKTALAAKLQMSAFGLERLKLVIAGRDAIAHMSHNVRSGRAWAPGLRDRRAQVSSGLGGCRSDETAPRAGHGGGHCANGIPWYFCGFEGQFANLQPQSVAPMADSGTRRSAWQCLGPSWIDRAPNNALWPQGARRAQTERVRRLTQAFRLGQAVPRPKSNPRFATVSGSS
jgi:hypothetical protein